MSLECCPDHKPGIEAINGPIVQQTLRTGGRYKYNFKAFEYCPWCGKRQSALGTAEEPKVVPLSPSDIAEAKKASIPDFVLESVNELIAEKFSGRRAKILQDEIISRIFLKNSETTRSEIFNKGWLDFEEVYRKAGWKVEYDKPAYDETYPAYFVFSKKSD